MRGLRLVVNGALTVAAGMLDRLAHRLYRVEEVLRDERPLNEDSLLPLGPPTRHQPR